MPKIVTQDVKLEIKVLQGLDQFQIHSSSKTPTFRPQWQMQNPDPLQKT